MKQFTCAKCGKEGERSNHFTKFCPECREIHKREQQIAKRFGSIDVQMKCVVCGFESDDPSDLTAHHVISRSKHPDGPTVVVCPNCHEAIHRIRRKQNEPLSESGLKKFGELVKDCTTMIKPGWRTPYS